MFTGIVEELGRVVAAERTGATTRFTFGADLVMGGTAIGDSIAVNGCCLTVVSRGEDSFSIDAVDETLARTNLGALEPGSIVNLERSTAVGGRLGGHFVLGHIDDVATVVEPAPHLVVELPPRLRGYVVEKGAIAIDGCSLTVAAIEGPNLRIEIIPHTSVASTLGSVRAGARVNVEVDIVAKYVERFVAPSVSDGTVEARS